MLTLVLIVAMSTPAAPRAKDAYVKSFKGFTASVKTGGAGAKGRKRAADAMKEDGPLLEKAVEHYLSGKHPFGRLRHLVSETKKFDAAKAAAPIRMLGWSVALHLSDRVPEAIRRQVSIELVLAQFHGWGIYASSKRLFKVMSRNKGLARYGEPMTLPGWDALERWLNTHLTEEPFETDPTVYVGAAMQQRPMLEQAARTGLVPRAYRAKLLLGALDGAAVSENTLKYLSGIEPTAMGREANLALILCPGDKWDETRAMVMAFLAKEHSSFGDDDPYSTPIEKWLQQMKPPAKNDDMPW